MASEQAQKIGARIRERRRELGMTQAEIASAFPSEKVTSTYVSRWERGEHRPADDSLDRLAEILQTTVADLISGPKEGRDRETPDLLGVKADDDATQLDRIEAAQADILDGIDAIASAMLSSRDADRDETLAQWQARRRQRSEGTGPESESPGEG